MVSVSRQNFLKGHTRWPLFLGFALVLLSLAFFAALRLVVAQDAPQITTDKSDYVSTETVTITGGGFEANTNYDVPVIRPDGSIVTGDGSFSPGWDTVLSDGSGSFTYLYKLDGIEGTYEVRVYYSPWSGSLGDPSLASTTFTDANPAGDLDQCANGGVGDPPVPCSGSAWQNGNLNANQAHYLEGQSVPYRLRMENLATGPTAHTVTIEWDTTQSGKHAIDYLTSFDRTEPQPGNNPCSAVPPATGNIPNCNTAVFGTFAIPVDANVTKGQNGVDDPPPGPTGGDDITQVAGVFTLYGGTITFVSGYTLSGTYAGNSSTSITISFTTNVSNPVLAWGGHIAARQDWGSGNSAIDISGSPFHMRFIDLDGKGGNQDRALQSGAVIFPATITIIKDALPNDAQDFAFTTTGLTLSAFSLDDDSDPTLSNTQVFSGITTFGTKTVTEADPAPTFALTDLVCTEDKTQNSSISLSTRRATIVLEEGEVVTCTFTNTLQTGTLRVIKNVVNDNGGSKGVADFPLFIDGSPVTSGVANTVAANVVHTASETEQAG